MSIVAGIVIDCNDVQLENAFSEIREGCDPQSNVKDESDLHVRKQSSGIIMTEAGRQNDRKLEQNENAVCPISCSSDWNSNAGHSRDFE
jgi:hypothetical protein